MLDVQQEGVKDESIGLEFEDVEDSLFIHAQELS